MTTFRYSGILVEVTDSEQAERIADIVGRDTYTSTAIDRAAPGMMTALRLEHKSCTDIGVIPDKFLVEKGKVKSEMTPDRRHMKAGTQIGNR